MDIFSRVMETFEADIRRAVAFLIQLKKKPTQALFWLSDF